MKTPKTVSAAPAMKGKRSTGSKKASILVADRMPQLQRAQQYRMKMGINPDRNSAPTQQGVEKPYRRRGDSQVRALLSWDDVWVTPTVGSSR